MPANNKLLLCLLSSVGLVAPDSVAKTEENVACEEYVSGKLSNNGLQTINVPTHSTVYPNNVDCKWEITIPQNMYLQVEIKHIDLEFYQVDRKLEKHSYGQACRYDALRIYNHAKQNLTEPGIQKSLPNYPSTLEETFGKLIANLCHGDYFSGKIIPYLQNGTFSLHSMTDTVLINFITDKDVQKSGFRLQLQLTPLAENACIECLDYDSVIHDLPKSRLIPSHSGNSNDHGNNGEKVVPLAMAVMLLLCCIMIGLIKQVENDQMEGMVMRELLVQNPSATNCSYGAQVARAQNALMAGLLERRPSVLELASRLVQEDQLYMQARQAIGEQPPSYIDPLGTQSNSNQAEHAVHQGDTQNTINNNTNNNPNPQDPLNNWQNYAGSIHIENNNTNNHGFQNNPPNNPQNTPQNTFQTSHTPNYVMQNSPLNTELQTQRSTSTSTFRNFFAAPKVDSDHSLSRQNSMSSLLPSYSNSMLESLEHQNLEYQKLEYQKLEYQKLENQRLEYQKLENQKNHQSFENHNMEASDSSDSTETVIQIDGNSPRDRRRSGLSLSSNSFTPSEIIYEESELRIDANNHSKNNVDQNND